MKHVTRRSVIAGSAAAVTAIPAVGLCASAGEDAYERIRRLTRELEAAMREAYNSDDVQILSWGPHNPNDHRAEVSPAVFIVAHPG